MLKNQSRASRTSGAVALGLAALLGVFPLTGASQISPAPVDAEAPVDGADGTSPEAESTDPGAGATGPGEIANPDGVADESADLDSIIGPDAQVIPESFALQAQGLGTVTGPPAGAHYINTTPGDYTTIVPETIPGYTGQVCSVTITALAGAGGNVNDTTNAGAGNYKNGSGAAATATYAVRPGMEVTGHVGGGGRYNGVTYTDPAYATDISGHTTLWINGSDRNPNTLRARADGGVPDGGYGGSMPGAWWGNIRHVGAGGGGSSAVSISGEELVVVGGGGGNGGGHSTLIGVGGDGGQPVGPGVAPGMDGTDGADSPWYQSHTNYNYVGNINENLANSGQPARTIYWNNPLTEPNLDYVPGGGQGGQATGPGAGGKHRIAGNEDAVIAPLPWTTYPTNSQYLRNQRNSLLHGSDGAERIGGNGGEDQIFFRGVDPQGIRRTTGNPDSGGGGGGGYYGGGGGASTISYGLSISANRGVTGGGGGGGASYVSPGGITTADGVIGPVSAIDSGLGPKALSQRDGADGFVALEYSTDCGQAWKSVDVAPLSETIVDEDGSHAQAGQTVRYTLHFQASERGDYAVDHVDHLHAVLDDADWVGDIRYGDSETVSPVQQTPFSPGVEATYDGDSETVRVTGTVPAGQIRTVSFTVQVKPSFPDRTADGADYTMTNFLGEDGVEPPAECEPDDPGCTENPVQGAVRWQKVDEDGSPLAGSEWTLTGPEGAESANVVVADCIARSAAECAGPDIDPAAGGFMIDPLARGDYVLVETMAPDGYELDPTEHPFSIAAPGGLIAMDLGDIVNVRAEGTAAWTKVDPDGDALRGSEWILTGPGGAASQTIEIDDCIEDAVELCDGPDEDPAPGRFRITGLAPGGYTLVETAAPAGYVLDTTPHTFTIGAGESADITLDDIENKPQDALVLPLTGGIGTDAFLLLGGGLLGLVLIIAVLRARQRRTRTPSAING